MRLVSLLLGVAAALLTACGGGGGSSTGGGGAGVNRAPTAVIGSAQVGVIGELLTFSGAASSDPDGNTITYAWTIISAPAGNTATLSGATTVTPSLRPNVAGTYQLSLVVSDASLSSAASTTTATVNVDAANQGQQQAAQISATVDVGTSIAKLRWTDSFPAGANYRVEIQQTDGSFLPVETLAGIGGTSGAMEWSRTLTGQTSFRVIALASARELPLLSATGQSILAVSPLSNLAIALSRTEPVFGLTNVSVTNAPAGATVNWYLDLANLGSGNPYTWNTTTAVNGSHLLQAILNLGGGAFAEVRKPVTVSNTPLVLNVTHNTVAGTTSVIAKASSGVGIASVSSRIADIGTIDTLTAKNYCDGACPPSDPFDSYRFTYNNLSLGNHTAIVIATDGGGIASQVNHPITISPAPVTLSVASPLAGSFVFGNLHVEGTATSDPGNTVTTKVSVGAVQFLSTTASNFSSDYDLTGLPPGSYTVTVVSTGSGGPSNTRQIPITVVPSAALAYSPIFQSDTFTTIVDVVSDRLLWGDVNAAAARINVLGTFQSVVAEFPFMAPALMTPDWVYVRGNAQQVQPPPAGCGALASSCVNRFSTATGKFVAFPDPSLTNSSSTQIMAAGNFVAWQRTNTEFAVFNTATNASTSVVLPAGVTGVRSSGLGVAGGEPMLFYWGTTSTGATFYKWTSAAGSVALPGVAAMTGISTTQFHPVQSDGTYVVWLTTDLSNGAYQLWAVSVNGGAPVAVYATSINYSTEYELRDGAIGWRVTTSPDGGVTFTNAWKMWSAALGAGPTPGTIFSNPGLPAGIKHPQAVGSGYVAYYDPANGGGMYTWNATTGQVVQRTQGGPYNIWINGNKFYFHVPGAGVFRGTLN